MAFKSSGVICPEGSPAGSDLMSILLIPGNPPSWRTAWCANHQGKGSSIATTADNKTAVVWAVGAETSNKLFAFDGDTGRQLFESAPLGPVRPSPLARQLCLPLTPEWTAVLLLHCYTTASTSGLNFSHQNQQSFIGGSPRRWVSFLVEALESSLKKFV